MSILFNPFPLLYSYFPFSRSFTILVHVEHVSGFLVPRNAGYYGIFTDYVVFSVLQDGFLGTCFEP